MVLGVFGRVFGFFCLTFGQVALDGLKEQDLYNRAVCVCHV